MSDQTLYKYDVFISYSHDDRDWVRKELLPRLEQAGLKVIIDYRDFVIGMPSLVNIETAVDNSRYTLVVLTPAWLESQWAEFEGLLVSTRDPAGRKRKLIPLMLEPCQQLPPRIAMLTYADFTVPSQRDTEMERLLKSIGPPESLLSLQSPEKEPSDTALRRIDAATPSHAQVGQRIDLLVQVRFPDSPLLGIEEWSTTQRPSAIEQTSEPVDLQFPVDPRTGKPSPARLEIRVVAPDFRIEGAAQQVIWVPPDRNSAKVAFLLTATVLGNCRINVEVYSSDQVYLGTVPVETAVGEMAVSPTANVANLFLFVVVAGQETSDIAPELVPQPTKKGVFPQILRDPMWQGIAAVVGILACIAAWFVVPEFRQIVGLGQPTSLPTPTADVISTAAAIPTGTPAGTPEFTPVSFSTGTPIPTDVPTITDTQPTTSLSTQSLTPEVSATSATGEPEIITIFAGKDSLTVYVPANVTSSLQDLNLEHRTNEQVERYFFADSDGFAPYIDGTVSEPFCLHLERAGSNAPFSLECRFAHRPTVGLPDGSIFWWDEFGSSTKTLFANLGTERLGICAAGFSRCSIEIP
jgi:hypothetical protein